MKSWLGWAVGIASFGGFTLVAKFLGAVIGVPIILEFDRTIVVEHRLYDEEIDSAFTSFGLAITTLFGMLASRIGMAISHGSWRGGLSLSGEFIFQAWAAGLAIYGAVSALLYLLSGTFNSEFASFIFNLMDVGFAAVIAWAMHSWYRQRIEQLNRTLGL